MASDDLNIYVSYDNKISIVLFVNSSDTFYVSKPLTYTFDQIEFINTPRDINYFDPVELINYYIPHNTQLKYRNLLIEGLYALFAKIFNRFDLSNKDEFSVSFTNNKFISNKDEDAPYYFRKEYIDNPKYRFIEISFKRKYDAVSNQFYFDVIIFYKLNITFDGKSKVITDIVISKIILDNHNYINDIIFSLFTSLDKYF